MEKTFPVGLLSRMPFSLARSACFSALLLFPWDYFLSLAADVASAAAAQLSSAPHPIAPRSLARSLHAAIASSVRPSVRNRPVLAFVRRVVAAVACLLCI